MAEVVALENVSKNIGTRTVLRGLSATAEAGDIIGVLGKNGAGKTTLLEVLLGFSPPDGGKTRVFGQDSMRLSETAKSRIGFVPQQDELVQSLSGVQQLKIGASFHRGWDHGLADRLQAKWDLPVQRPIRTMSVGERQKLSILLALGHHPDLLVLDEPVASLDPMARRAFLQELLAVPEGSRRTALFSSHIVSDLERAANKIWVMKKGQLVWQGDLDDLKESVVRLHIGARVPLPPELHIPCTLSSRIEDRRATVSVSEWHPDQTDLLSRRLQADIEVERLSLEEIFLEVHR